MVPEEPGPAAGPPFDGEGVGLPADAGGREGLRAHAAAAEGQRHLREGSAPPRHRGRQPRPAQQPSLVGSRDRGGADAVGAHLHRRPGGQRHHRAPPPDRPVAEPYRHGVPQDPEGGMIIQVQHGTQADAQRRGVVGRDRQRAALPIARGPAFIAQPEGLLIAPPHRDEVRVARAPGLHQRLWQRVRGPGELQLHEDIAPVIGPGLPPGQPGLPHGDDRAAEAPVRERVRADLHRAG